MRCPPDGGISLSGCCHERMVGMLVGWLAVRGTTDCVGRPGRDGDNNDPSDAEGSCNYSVAFAYMRRGYI